MERVNGHVLGFPWGVITVTILEGKTVWLVNRLT